MSGDQSARASRAVLVGGAAVCAGVVVAGEPLRGWLLVALIVAATGAAAVATRRNPSRQNPAWCILLGAALLVPAYVLWYPAKLRWGLELGNPAITDGFFLAGYVAFLVALTRLIRVRGSVDRRIHLLDSLIISVGLGVLVWVLFIAPYLHDEELSGAATVVAVSYTVVDLLLFGAVVRLLVQGGIASTGDRLLTGWVVAQLSADLLYSVTSMRGTFELSGLTPVLYSASFVLLGAAILHPSTLAVGPGHRAERPMSG
ncbi:MAG: hypothetical protein ABIX10_15905, partial [Acidimicrobiales bacterium]